MSYAIIHMQKLKQSAIKGMQIHNQREKESQTNPDIDATRSHLNYDLANPEPVDYNEKVNKMIEDGVTTGKAIRKDAVRIASFMVTSDKEFFDNLSETEEKRFFESAYEFLCDEYGEKNMAYAMVHKDEKTPHMHVGFVPITEDGRLSAKDFFGKKLQLVKLQDKFHEHMREAGFDLERGLSSNKKHIETAKYKALTSQQIEQEAQQNYEKLVERIKEIDTSKKEVEEIKHKKLPLGHVGIKSDDYTYLVERAQQSALYQAEARFLEEEVERAKEEIKRLETEVKAGQDAIRKQYKQMELENEELKNNFEDAVQQKVEEKVQPLLDEQKEKFQEIYSEVVSKHNNLAEKYREQKAENEQLKVENKALEKENQGLNQSVKTLQLKLNGLVEEFTKYKERVTKALHKQLDKVKGFLEVRNVDKETIKKLDEVKREQLVSERLRDIERPRQKRENELER